MATPCHRVAVRVWVLLLLAAAQAVHAEAPEEDPTPRAVQLVREVGSLEHTVKHWEERAQTANAEVLRLQTENDALRKSLGAGQQYTYDSCTAIFFVGEARC